MGFELWYSRTNKIRRNGTSFKELKQIFVDSISTKQIFEEFDRCELSEHPIEAKNYLKERDFDILGVVDNGQTIGYIKQKDLSEGKIADFLIPIDQKLLISSSTPFSKLIQILTQYDFALVLNENDINGIVTKADINKPLVRLYLFGIISLFEMHINFWINQHLKVDVKEVLNQKRYEAAEKIFDVRQRGNDQLTILDCLQISDKRDILRDFPLFLETFDFSKIRFDRLMSTVEIIRNEIAHSQHTIINSLDWLRFVSAIQETEIFLEKSEMELIK